MKLPWIAERGAREIASEVLTLSRETARLARAVALDPERRAALVDALERLSADAKRLGPDVARVRNPSLEHELSESQLDLLFIEQETQATSLRLARFFEVQRASVGKPRATAVSPFRARAA